MASKGDLLMPIIKVNRINNKDLEGKVSDFITPKIHEVEKNIAELLASAEVNSLEEVLNLETPKEQGEHNFVLQLKEVAYQLQKQQQEYLFLLKTETEILDYLDHHFNQESLELCAKKVRLYRELKRDIEADMLENEVKEIAQNRKITKKTLSEIFKIPEKPKQKQSTKKAYEEGWFYGKTDDEIVEILNEKHAGITEMKEFAVLLETRSGKLVLQRKSTFKEVYYDQIVRIELTGQPITLADIWLDSPNKRKYNEITFDPDPNRTMPEKDYNLWKGFSFEPKEGDITPFKDFTREVICNGNQEHFNYLWGWIARMIQKPHEVGETAIVLKGKQGTGKNTFVETIGHLFGDHFKPLSSIEQLLGRFDFHHANAILIHANEAIWGGDKRMLGKLKTLVTEKEVTVEQKFVDPITLKNCRHVILSSNEDWPVHLDRDDRRFLVLEVNDNHKEDADYFKKLIDWRKNGGYEALLFHLQNHDNKNFNLRSIPQSATSFDIKLDSAPTTEVYLYEALKEGRFCIHLNPDEGVIVDLNQWTTDETRSFVLEKHVVYKGYVLWCEEQKIKPESSRKMGRSIARLMPSTNMETRVEGGATAYGFPSLYQARKQFEKTYKCEGERIWGNTLKIQNTDSKILTVF